MIKTVVSPDLSALHPVLSPGHYSPLQGGSAAGGVPCSLELALWSASSYQGSFSADVMEKVIKCLVNLPLPIVYKSVFILVPFLPSHYIIIPSTFFHQSIYLIFFSLSILHPLSTIICLPNLLWISIHPAIYPFFYPPIIQSFLPSLHLLWISIHSFILRSSNPSFQPSIFMDIHLSIHPFILLSSNHPTLPPLHFYGYPSIHPSIHSSILQASYPSIPPFLWISIYPSTQLSIYSSILQPSHPSIHQFLWIFSYPSIQLSIHSSIL